MHTLRKHHPRLSLVLATGLAWLFIVVANVRLSWAESYLVLESESGDFVGQGSSSFYTDDGLFLLSDPSWIPAIFNTSFNYADPGRGVRFGVESLDDIESFSDYWVLQFDAPGALLLSRGSYSGAVRFPFNEGATGLSVSGQGRGCNQLNGSFTVHDITYNTDASLVTSAIISFEQRCDGSNALLKGTLVYQHSFTIPTDNDSCESFLNSIQTFLESIVADNTLLTTLLGQGDSSIRQLINSVAELREDLAAREQRILSLLESIDESENERRRLTTVVSELESSLAASQSENGSTQNALQAALQQLEALRGQILSTEPESTDAGGELQRLIDENAELKAQLKVVRSRTRKLRKRLKRARRNSGGR